MNLYFGNFVTTASTVLVVAVWAFIALNVFKHKSVEKWGKRIAALAFLGLLTCCFVATRDSFHLSVQASFDQTVASGRFAINGIQASLCYIGVAIIAFSSISSSFVKKQKYRKTMFFVLSCVIILKTSIIEISRLMV